jgi:hypothetical protein
MRPEYDDHDGAPTIAAWITVGFLGGVLGLLIDGICWIAVTR